MFNPDSADDDEMNYTKIHENLPKSCSHKYESSGYLSWGVNTFDVLRDISHEFTMRQFCMFPQSIEHFQSMQQFFIHTHTFKMLMSYQISFAAYVHN